MELPLVQALVVSLSAGALVGLIRQWADQHPPESETSASTNLQSPAGLRTYALWGLLGCLSAYLGETFSFWVYITTLVLLGSFLSISAFRDGQDQPGLTSPTSALLTFFVGTLVYLGETTVAVLICASLLVLIAIKPLSHNWTSRLRHEDVRLMVQFAAISGIVLPLVPNRAFGPLDAFNPFNIWLMVVLISGLGFLGYAAMRWFGARAGITLTGIAGGLASSTATTLALARESRGLPALSKTFAQGILIANVIVIFRVLLIVLAIHPPLFFALVAPAGLLVAPTCLIAGASAWQQHRSHKAIKMPEVKNPLSLSIAIKFAGLYAIIVFLLRAVEALELTQGLYPLAFLSGLTDMDAIALSLANTASEGSPPVEIAARAILLAAVANTCFKLGLALSLGARELRFPVSLGLGAMIFSGVLTIFIF